MSGPDMSRDCPEYEILAPGGHRLVVREPPQAANRIDHVLLSRHVHGRWDLPDGRSAADAASAHCAIHADLTLT